MLSILIISQLSVYVLKQMVYTLQAGVFFHELFTVICKCFVCIMSGRAAHKRAFSLSRGGRRRRGGTRYRNQIKSQYTHKFTTECTIADTI